MSEIEGIYVVWETKVISYVSFLHSEMRIYSFNDRLGIEIQYYCSEYYYLFDIWIVEEKNLLQSNIGNDIIRMILSYWESR